MTVYKYPNVILETEDVHNHITTKPDGTLLDIHVTPHMALLIDTVAVKYPTWEFRLYDARKIDLNTISAKYFKVFNDANPREHVGNISTSNRYNRDGQSEPAYVIGGKRLAASRERGTAVETKHVKSAVKAIDKYFVPAPWDERIDNVFSEGAVVIQYAESEAGGLLRRADSGMHEITRRFITDNWDMFLSTLNPKEQELAGQRVELFRAHQELSKLQSEVTNKRNMLTLIIEGDKYVVQTSQGISICNSEQLPEEVRRKIGMLKLVNVRDVLPNIGTRVTAGYLIMLDQPLQQGA